MNSKASYIIMLISTFAYLLSCKWKNALWVGNVHLIVRLLASFVLFNHWLLSELNFEGCFLITWCSAALIRFQIPTLFAWLQILLFLPLRLTDFETYLLILCLSKHLGKVPSSNWWKYCMLPQKLVQIQKVIIAGLLATNAFSAKFCKNILVREMLES